MISIESTRTNLSIGRNTVSLTNINKIMYPALGLTKADVIAYYINMSEMILPYLKKRPFSMISFVNGADAEPFFQKQRPDGAPKWLKSVGVSSNDRVIDYCMVNDLPSLLFMANRGCLEMHAWFSRYPTLDKPDVAVFDIDPSGNTGFKEACAAAMLIKIILDSFSLWSIPKTSGKQGIHIFVPIVPVPYEEVRVFLKTVCGMVVQANSKLFTTERSVNKRGNRVYLDAVQVGKGKTLPAPYSLRATPQATVSTPITWEELEDPSLLPTDFTIQTIPGRLGKTGDLFAPIYTKRQKLIHII